MKGREKGRNLWGGTSIFKQWFPKVSLGFMLAAALIFSGYAAAVAPEKAPPVEIKPRPT